MLATFGCSSTHWLHTVTNWSFCTSISCHSGLFINTAFFRSNWFRCGFQCHGFHHAHVVHLSSIIHFNGITTFFWTKPIAIATHVVTHVITTTHEVFKLGH